MIAIERSGCRTDSRSGARATSSRCGYGAVRALAVVVHPQAAVPAAVPEGACAGSKQQRQRPATAHLVCAQVWTSRPALWARRQWRRYDGALPIMHPGELDASSLSDMVGYPVAIVGSGHIGDGKMSTIARIDYVGIESP